MLTHDEISRLTAPERFALISELWDSLNDAETPLQIPQFQELQLCIATFNSDRAHAVS